MLPPTQPEPLSCVGGAPRLPPAPPPALRPRQRPQHAPGHGAASSPNRRGLKRGGGVLRRGKAGCVFICLRTSPPLPSFLPCLVIFSLRFARSQPPLLLRGSKRRAVANSYLRAPAKTRGAGGLDKADGVLGAASYLRQRAARVASEGGVPLKHPPITPAFLWITCRPHAEPSHTQAAGD